MRFEAMEYRQKMRFMQRLHGTINRGFFKSKLKPVMIDIRNLNKTTGDDCLAMYCKADELQPDRILFSHEFVELIEQQRTQRKQAVIFFQIMLHEMIHQYCAENGIDETGGHNEQWQQAAALHGLHSVYNAGTLQEEWLEPWAAGYAVNSIRIR